jgi:signal transduction histidine kinase
MKKEQLYKKLSHNLLLSESIMVEKINSTFFIIEKMGKEIVKKPDDKKYIKKILEKYKSDTSLHQIFSWTIFSWSSLDSKIIVDGEYGILKKPVDLSDRDYIPKSIANPWKMFIGKPVYGSTSKKWMIPGGSGISNSNNENENEKVFGSITIGFEIQNLAKIIQQEIRDENVNISLYYENKFPVFIANKSSVKIFSQEEIEEYSKNSQNFQDKNHSSLSQRNLEKGFAIKRQVENYPYVIFANYDENFISSIVWEVVYSRIIEILVIIFLSAILILIIYTIEKERRGKDKFLIEKEVLDNFRKDFLLSISCELKRFISGIIGLSDIIKEKILEENINRENVKDEMISHLEHINDINQELIRFINDLVDIHNSENDKLDIQTSEERVDFEDLIDRSLIVLKSKIKKKRIVINSFFEDGLNKVINLDEKRVKQILISIISNALNYSKENSKIEISVKNFGKNQVKISIKDFGIGMKESQIKSALRIYDPMEYKKKGINNSIELPLPIVKFLIEKQNGIILIESTKNYGTTVVIIF